MKNKYQSAFPIIETDNPNSSRSLGLTKREYYAGLCLQGIVGNSDGLEKIGNVSSDNPENMVKNIVWLAVKFADALLEQLENNEINP